MKTRRRDYQQLARDIIKVCLAEGCEVSSVVMDSEGVGQIGVYFPKEYDEDRRDYTGIYIEPGLLSTRVKFSSLPFAVVNAIKEIL